MASLLALILLCVVWELWVAPLHPGGSLLVLKVLPLLPAVPGVLRGRAQTFRWLSLLLWFYAAEGITRALMSMVHDNSSIDDALALVEA